ncbi:hypothetical protein M378DRAFT_162837 [Amanita muscaria Koide BX008]|uniref:Uncharacterized protein n=1 Tax=Amanita muscaria (strain Koide BX008) TaxID=946122 RepID=A0A0C2WSN1_AMAMK|nr:hypothetical protein M378DRAFT_162837 [Amanita muscaria Koide BX008]
MFSATLNNATHQKICKFLPHDPMYMSCISAGHLSCTVHHGWFAISELSSGFQSFQLADLL